MSVIAAKPRSRIRHKPKSAPSPATQPLRLTEAEWRKRTIDDEIADMRAFRKEICKSKESALGFLQRAGILDEHGEFTEPYRALAE